ncbi:unnamed protein product [Ectocarpus sp. 4 AP-2014]|uniref:EsV-1-168 n=1 Tax=Ectocarpus siliculosus virus 1 (isolate New Zealand/Kaikoura/1988) TaxID=654926 RepID=Q8QNB7_ESV1K|nr:EsV-1-168 [Ectocarpus siliculosus virus 1]AAK14582.1 EsV-1-168 [Ectocarpus siliculosus virus 1]
MFNELVKFIPAINKHFFPKKNTAVHDGTRCVLAEEELTYEECEPFLPLRDGDVVFCPSCYDGDSFRLTWTDRSGYKSRIMGRLLGVDTPEIRGSSDKEKALALRAKQRLSDVISGEFVTIRKPGNEKYGRALCDLQTDTLASVSEYMIADPDICRPYDGGKKVSWD